MAQPWLVGKELPPQFRVALAKKREGGKQWAERAGCPGGSGAGSSRPLGQPFLSPARLIFQAFQGEESKRETCLFHPGVPVFHEG